MIDKKEILLKALEKSYGNITATCNAIGISRQTFYDYVNNDEKFKNRVEKVLTNIPAQKLDITEESLFKQIKKGNQTAIMYYLNNHGQERGYNINKHTQTETTKQSYNFINFLKAFNRNYQNYNHIDFIRERLSTNVKQGKSTYIAMPPQHGKTTSTLATIGEIMLNNAGIKVAYCSYSQRFSESRVKELKNAFEEFGFRGDVWSANQIILNNKSKLIITSIGGGITGEPVDLLVIDDSIKGFEEAFSIVTKEKIWNWFQTEAETRLPENGVIIAIGTRWHSEDLIGKIKTNRNYDGIDIKALAEENDILGRACNEPLFPERYSKEYLLKIQSEKPELFDLQYQGNDKALSDAIFKEVNYYDDIESTNLIYSIGADLSYTNNAASDYTAYVVKAYDQDNDIDYIVDAKRWKGEVAESMVRLKMLQEQYQCIISMEYNGTQIGVVDLLVREGIRINKVKINSSKLVRALPVSQKWNSGKVKVNRNIDAEFITEICNFTGTAADRNDDYLDALVYSNSLRIIK